MINPVEWWRQRQARRRYMPEVRNRSAARTARVAMIALAVLIAAAALLEMRRAPGADAALTDYARESAAEPLDLIEAAGRSRRLVFLGDVPGSAAPKRLAGEAIERLAGSSGLDYVVLDVPSDEQPFIDRYLATAPEDPSLLLGRPDAVREGDPSSRALLDVYRTIWRVNEELGADRRIRVIAADLPDWPPRRGTAPSQAATLFGQRSEHMLQQVQDRGLSRNARARMLFLVDGLQALKAGGARLQTGGTRPVEAPWLAARLRELAPQDVYTVLMDASAGAAGADVVAYHGTAAGAALRRAGVATGTALRVDARFDELSRTPVDVRTATGVEFSLQGGSTFSELADAYVFLGN